MKKLMLTTLMGTAVMGTALLGASAAQAEMVHTRSWYGTSAPTVLSSPSTTQTQVTTETRTTTPMRTTTSTRVYNREIRQYETQSGYRMHNDEDARSRTQYYSTRYTRPQDISPAAGSSVHIDVPPSARVMGEIQGGVSYNDY